MSADIRNLLSQPLVGITTLTVALSLLAASWITAVVSSGTSGQPLLSTLLVLALVVALVMVQCFPIQVRRGSKIHMGSVPVYLMCVLLSPPIAATAVLAGMLIGELSLRSDRGGYLSDVASQVGRWTMVALAASLVAHLPQHGDIASAMVLLGTGLALWAGDMLTSPLVYCPITREMPWHVITAMTREAGMLEGAQYLVGMLGAAAAQHQLWTLVLLALPTLMVYLTGKRAKELQDNTRQILVSMADAVDLRDPYTGGHSRRVTDYTSGILRSLNIKGPDAEIVVESARVHDIGKIGMPDGVLLKEGKLTDDEWAIMQSHPEQGAELLKRYPDFARGVEVVRHHHERWDGEGYPHRLRETAIPFGSRVIAVADSFDAMTSDRPYRRGMSVDKAAAILREGRGRQWDGEIVDAFLQSIAGRLGEPVAPILRLVPRPSDEAVTA